jgi:hypothetical protein
MRLRFEPPKAGVSHRSYRYLRSSSQLFFVEGSKR